MFNCSEVKVVRVRLGFFSAVGSPLVAFLHESGLLAPWLLHKLVGSRSMPLRASLLDDSLLFIFPAVEKRSDCTTEVYYTLSIAMTTMKLQYTLYLHTDQAFL